MRRKDSPYSPQFKSDAVKLTCLSERSPSEIASDLNITLEVLSEWLKQELADTGGRRRLTAPEREELERLRKDNEILEEERDTMRKVAASFARGVFDTLGPRGSASSSKESDSTPSSSEDTG